MYLRAEKYEILNSKQEETGELLHLFNNISIVYKYPVP